MFVRGFFIVALSCVLAGGVMAGPSELSSQATQALAAGNAGLAASLFEEIVVNFPSSPEAPDAALKRAYLGLRLEEPYPDELFLRVTALYPDAGQAADALRRLGYLKQREGRLDAAQDFFQRAANHPGQTQRGTEWSIDMVSSDCGTGTLEDC